MKTQRKKYGTIAKSDYIERSLKNLSREIQFITRSLPILRPKEDTIEAVTETIEEGNAEERRALALIAVGDLNGGLELLIKLASESAVDNMKQWRNIGRLSYSVDTTKALVAYKKVIAFDQSDVQDAIYLGRLYQRTGSLLAARSIFEKTLDRLPKSDERDRSVLFNEIGDVQKAQGDLSAALESYRAAITISRRLAKADPDNADWQRDLSVSHNKIGDVQKAQGDLSAALESYRATITISERLAKADPANAGWQRDLSVSHDQDWRCTGGARRFICGTGKLQSRYNHKMSILPKPIQPMLVGREICRCRITRLAMYRRRKATYLRRWKATEPI